MIIAEHLTKRYENGFVAVQDMNLHVNEGDIYGFLGPNGAGKTTTIRMLTGLIPPSEGKVTIQGMDVESNVRRIKRLIGVLPESHGYYNWMTGKEYLELFADLYGVPKDIKKRRVQEVLEWVTLTEKSHVPVGQYSRGMRQRLGIAKTMIHGPSVIFLDEPTLGLDPQGQLDIKNMIRELNVSRKVTVFITSHFLKEISDICNRVAIVKKGSLVEEGGISALTDKYRQVLGKDQPTLEDIFFHLTTDEAKGEPVR